MKKGLLLAMVGGKTTITSDGMLIRGNIHVCLIGDPGIGKSQLLKYVARSAPHGIYVAGTGASHAGLTACVVSDPFRKELNLQSGAFVRADNGIICIDEFDKMGKKDQEAL